MKHIQIYESFSSPDPSAEELDNWIEDNSDYISENSLRNKVEEMIPDAGEITSESYTIQDPGGKQYGENWDTKVLVVKLDGQDLVKVCVNQNGKYNFGKNVLEFQDAPQDKIVSAPFGGGPRFFFDSSIVKK